MEIQCRNFPKYTFTVGWFNLVLHLCLLQFSFDLKAYYSAFFESKAEQFPLGFGVHTRVTIFFLSLTMKKQEFDIENYFIVFRNILLDGEYTFAFVQTIYQSSFSNLLGTPP